jgi:hypothetical protein
MDNETASPLVAQLARAFDAHQRTVSALMETFLAEFDGDPGLSDRQRSALARVRSLLRAPTEPIYVVSGAGRLGTLGEPDPFRTALADEGGMLAGLEAMAAKPAGMAPPPPAPAFPPPAAPVPEAPAPARRRVYDLPPDQKAIAAPAPTAALPLPAALPEPERAGAVGFPGQERPASIPGPPRIPIVTPRPAEAPAPVLPIAIATPASTPVPTAAEPFGETSEGRTLSGRRPESFMPDPNPAPVTTAAASRSMWDAPGAPSATPLHSVGSGRLAPVQIEDVRDEEDCTIVRLRKSQVLLQVVVETVDEEDLEKIREDFAINLDGYNKTLHGQDPGALADLSLKANIGGAVYTNLGVDDLVEWAQSGRIQAGDLIARNEANKWTRADSIYDLRAIFETMLAPEPPAERPEPRVLAETPAPLEPLPAKRGFLSRILGRTT